MDFVKYDSTDLGQSYFDLNNGNLDLALEELDSLPFFSDIRLVIFENLTNMTTEKKSVFDDKQMKRFEDFLENPVDFTQLVIILHGKLDSRLKSVKKTKKSGQFIRCQKNETDRVVQLF
ncbi:hypothetical protein [Lactococcus fujiensis]|uniref:hypothetical protein n=1 Tax=Lactococcus fujiensis TaxID=610251 RepID=UPI000AF7E9DC|nr:hypothetical protein [Lactococcus fujiensis]